METHSFRLELGGRPTRNKTYQVYLTVTIGGRRSRIKTPVEVAHQNDFNTKAANNKWIRSGVPDATKLNNELSRMIQDARNRYIEMQRSDGTSANSLTESIRTHEVTSSFTQYANRKREEYRLEGGIRNAMKYITFLNKLDKFLRGRDLLFGDITVSFLNAFKMFLERQQNETRKGKRLHPNTIQSIMNRFRALMNAAVKEGVIPVSKNPFISFTVKGVKTMREKLSDNELKRLAGLELKEGSGGWHSRNMFMLSFYAAGIRVGDMLQLRWRNVNDGRLVYQMGKNHKIRDLVLVQEALDILELYKGGEEKDADSYIFPFLDNEAPYASYVDQRDIDSMPLDTKETLMRAITSKTRVVDGWLKRLAVMADISKPLTMHISRHTFARMARESGIDSGAVQKIMAHSSLKVTENYMGDFDTKTTDNVLRNLFSDKDIGECATRDPKAPRKKKLSKEELVERITELLKTKDKAYLSGLYEGLVNDDDDDNDDGNEDVNEIEER